MQPIQERASKALLPLYATTMFLSALLMFAVQPSFTKMVLPRLGGSPAVWNTAMVFFQAMLLAGYLYAHVSTRLLGLRRQAILHGVILGLGLTALPIGVAAGWTAPPAGLEIPWLFGLLAVSLGLPFFALSATAPLLQLWFSHSAHARSSDPYFLYVGSNLGSLAALIGYPMLIEPTLGLSAQGWAWAAGYVVLVAGIGLCGASLWRLARTPSLEPPARAQAAAGHGVTWRTRLRWLMLSLAPSALLIGVTLHIATDITSAPFLWVIPLALYLTTFIIAFAQRPVLPHRWMLRLQLPVVGLAVVFFAVPGLYSILVLHLAVLFVTAMVCHGELARLRPPPAFLTEFYLWLSLGGVAGGMLAAIVAPLAFDGVYEYPLALAAALLLRPAPAASRLRAALSRITGAAATPQPPGSRSLAWALDLALPALLLVILAPWAGELVPWEPVERLAGVWFNLANIAWPHIDPWLRPLWPTGMSATAQILYRLSILALILLAWRRPLRFVLAAAATLAVFAPEVVGRDDFRLEQVRTFFRVHAIKIAEQQAGTFYLLFNGRTLHGGAMEGEPRRGITYYTEQGPVGQIFRALKASQEPVRRIGVVGLGVGSLACHAEGIPLTFFEIDPEVERIARDTQYFKFLSECGQDLNVLIGDGRLGLAKEPDESFDVIVIDAFSGDAIPVHLLTREAIALYMRKLGPRGKLILHITNTYADLLPVVASLVADAGLHGRHVEHDAINLADFSFPSRWVAIARTPEDLALLDQAASPWSSLQPDPASGGRVWTDDFSDVIRALRWGSAPTAGL